MGVISAAFFGVPKSNGAGFGGDEEDFGAGWKVFCTVERVDYEGGRDGGCCTGERRCVRLSCRGGMDEDGREALTTSLLPLPISDQ